jgi:hypothetical protein
MFLSQRAVLSSVMRLQIASRGLATTATPLTKDELAASINKLSEASPFPWENVSTL